MKKVIFKDHNYVIVTDEQAEFVADQKVKGQSFWLNHQNGRDFIDPVSIARITQAGRDDYQPKVDEDHRIAADTKPFDPNGPGYKSFLKAREKLIKKRSTQ